MKNKNTIFSDYPDVVTVEQLSTMLSISAKTAYKLVKEKKSNPFPLDVPIRYLKFLSWIIWKYRINPFKPGRHMI